MAAVVASADAPLLLTGAEAERFLKEADIVEVRSFDNKGITKPKKVTLSTPDVTADAVFKTIDVFHTKEKLTTGRVLFKLRDSYKHEIAAYELSKLLGLDFVPPTVERKIGRDRGSLTLWVNGTMTEWHRNKVKKVQPPDQRVWNNRMFNIRLFLQLTWDADYNNISNLLIDEDWKIWKIDSSRAFHGSKKLRREGSLTRFSRQFLQALRDLTREELDEALGPWLARDQLEGLWARRTRLLELAEERVQKRGEDAVLYDDP